MRIGIEFTAEQESVHRARLDYAFRLFCAVYGHEPVSAARQNESADVSISYAGGLAKPGSPRVALSNLYRPRAPRDPAPAPHRTEIDSETSVLLYPPEPGRTPDWLGEIFEWVSCADEYSVQTRDPVGRIPFADSYLGRHGLDPKIPYASAAMRRLERLVLSAARLPGFSRAQSQLIVNTHDVDYLPGGYFSNLKRLAKNAAISLIHHRRPGLAAGQTLQALSMMVGGWNPLDQLPALLAGEKQRNVGATYFFLLRSLHARDGNYGIESPGTVDVLKKFSASGMEIAVHGSYTSSETEQGIASEFAALREAGFAPAGNRQHWLRFTLDRLIPALEQAGVGYDSSLGWSDRIGFRAGASFPFPPYNFEEERPAHFLEIPLAVMDQSLRNLVGGKDAWYDEITKLFAISREYPGSAIVVLWHPTAFGGGQLPREVGDTFWRLVESKADSGDEWVSGRDCLSSIRPRYEAAGLLSRNPEALAKNLVMQS